MEKQAILSRWSAEGQAVRGALPFCPSGRIHRVTRTRREHGYNSRRSALVRRSSLGCESCGASEEDRRVQKCPICYKKFCEECAHPMSGRSFCSRFCAEYFFFGGEDDI